MLADTVMEIALRGHPVSFPYLKPDLAASIRLAQRFAVDRSFTTAAAQVHRSKPSSLLAALPLCRVPYPKIWIEREGDVGDPEWDVNVTRDAPIPKRFGVLVESFDAEGTIFMGTFFWQHHLLPESSKEEIAVNSLVGCPLGILGCTNDISVTETINGLPNGYHRIVDEAKKRLLVRRKFIRETVATNYASKYGRDQLDVLVALEERMASIASPYFYKADMLLAEHPGWINDITSEGGLLLSELALLNSRTNVEREDVPVEKINKKRRANGKSDLLSYSVVKIKLSQREQAAASASGMSAADVRKHLVRGHFKVRRSGVYWWRPFIRGTGPGEVRHTRYDVSTRPT